MKKLLFVFALMLVGLSPALAQTKVMYAEITEGESGDPNDLTITFKAVDADKVPAENFNQTTGLGTYNVSAQPWYTILWDSPKIQEKDIAYKIKKAVFDPSVADARPRYTSYLLANMCNLTTVEGIEYLNTSEVTNMSYMFSKDEKLENLDVTKFNTENVTNMSYIFNGCSALSSLDVSKFNTANVTNMGYMFSGCSKLSTLNVTGFNTEKVTNMEYMFNGCRGLSNLDVTKFHTENVTNMAGVFDGCSSLKSIDVTNFNTGKVTNMRAMFYGCSSLPTLDVTKLNTENVTDMSWMFSACSSLPSIDVTTLITGKVTDMGAMFYRCSKLTTLDVTKFNTENVTDMSWMFSACSSLPSIDVTKFKTGKVTKMNYMFYGCSKLTTLDVTKFNTENVTDMSGMFWSCSSLPSIDVSKFKTGNVTKMELMFSDCNSLTSLDVTNFDTKNVTKMNGMFYDCSKLSSIDVSKFNVQNAYSISNMFRGCSSLTSLDISKWKINARTINFNYNGGVSDLAFDCTNLTELNLGDNDFSAVASDRKRNVFLNVGNAQPCHITFTFDRSSLGNVTIDKKNSLPPYYNFLSGRFTIAEKLDCDKNLTEDYTPVAKENTDLWQPNRQLTTNDWNTLVVPVALTLEQLQQSFGTGVQVCRLVSYSDKKLYYKNVSAGESIPANEPVLVKPAEDIKNIGYANVNIEEATNDLTKTVTSGGTSVSFIGTYKSKLTLDDRSWLFYSPSWQAFVCSDGTAFIRKTRAYVKITGAPVNSLRIAIDDNGVTNDINSIDGTAIGQPEGPAYNLSGQRVGDDYKGIVIVNGKKLLRK